MVIERLHPGVQCRGNLMPALGPQLQKAVFLRDIGKRAFSSVREVTIQVDGQQFGKVLSRGDFAAATHQCRHEALTKLPLRGFVITRAHVVQDGVYLIEGFGAQGFWIHDLRHGHGGLKRGKGRLSEFSGCAGSAGAGIVGPEELDPCCIP